MKKHILITSLVLSAGLLVSGCVNKSVAATDTFAPDTQQNLLAFSSENIPQAYQSIIDKYQSFVDSDFNPEQFKYDKSYRIATSFNAAIKNGRIGYTLCDLNDDGSPELLIEEIVTPEARDRVIIDAYTLKDGQAEGIFFSSDRDRHYYINDYENERIIIANEWSNGASYSGRTYFIFAKNNQLKCIESVVYREGQWYEVDLNGKHFENLVDAKPIEENMALNIIRRYERMYTALDLTQFKSEKRSDVVNKQINNAGTGIAKMQAQYAEDVLGNFSDYTKFRADQSGKLSRIVFSVNKPVKDLKFLSVEFIDVDENGKAIFSFCNIYSQDTLEPHKPLVVEMNLPETIPNHGISYTDGNGTVRRYTIGLSGEDGSIFLSEF